MVRYPVLFVLALIAANATSGTCLGVGYFIWIAAGLLAFALDHLFDDRALRVESSPRDGSRDSD
jgi:hypothetical protein